MTRHHAAALLIAFGCALLGYAGSDLIIPAPAPPERILSPDSPPSFRIDLNRDPWYRLALLRGIGETKARRIVAYRQEHGGFRTIEDLARVPGISPGRIEAIRDAVVVGPLEPPGR